MATTPWLHPSDPNWIDADGKLTWRDGVAAVAFGAQAGTSLADLAANNRGFLEWVLRKDFSDEVKAVVGVESNKQLASILSGLSVRASWHVMGTKWGTTLIYIKHNILIINHLARINGGESGIRTHGRVTPTHAFQACSFNRSDISPHEDERPRQQFITAVSLTLQRGVGAGVLS